MPGFVACSISLADTRENLAEQVNSSDKLKTTIIIIFLIWCSLLTRAQPLHFPRNFLAFENINFGMFGMFGGKSKWKIDAFSRLISNLRNVFEYTDESANLHNGDQLHKSKFWLKIIVSSVFVQGSISSLVFLRAQRHEKTRFSTWERA